MLKRIVMLLVALSMTPFLFACNTIEGMGRDVSAVGGKMQQESVEHRGY